MCSGLSDAFYSAFQQFKTSLAVKHGKELSVHVFTVCNLDDRQNQNRIINTVNNTVFADSNAVKIKSGFKLFYPGRAWINA